jgi:uncharacterized membrane protein
MKTTMVSTRKWLIRFLVGYGIFITLPLLAPVMMHLDFQPVGKVIYYFYGFLCHQLPERSLFFFGSKLMYSLPEIQSVWPYIDNPLILRQFIGNSEMGWKIAWSDRMISLFGGIWLFCLLWSLIPNHGRKISIWIFLLLSVPMALDGGTHLLSDLSGLSQGFRYTNDWLAVLTRHMFVPSFYLGDAIGSFNSWARWISGLLFGFGLVWFAFPYFDEAFIGNSNAI